MGLPPIAMQRWIGHLLQGCWVHAKRVGCIANGVGQHSLAPGNSSPSQTRPPSSALPSAPQLRPAAAQMATPSSQLQHLTAVPMMLRSLGMPWTQQRRWWRSLLHPQARGSPRQKQHAGWPASASVVCTVIATFREHSATPSPRLPK